MKKNIFVSFKPSVLFNSTLEGEPVWPFFDQDDLEVFKDVCNSYNGISNLISDCDCNQLKTNISSDQTVIALGEHYKLEAELYAHLTKRNFLIISNINELFNSLVFPTVLLLSYHNLSSELLNFLYQKSNNNSAPGLLIDYEDNKFRNQLLFKSAAYYLSKTDPDNTVIEFLPTYSFKYFEHDNYVLAGNSTTKDTIINLITRKKSLLSIITHSDGIDAYLGKFSLCQIGAEALYENVSEAPLCINTGICYRNNISIQKAYEENYLLSPLRIRANILLWLTCRGIRLLPSMIEPLWGLAPVFASNPFIGAVITPWKIVFTDLEVLDSFSRKLNEYKIVGNAVAEFNRDNENNRLNLKLCIIGDPELYFSANKTTEAVHNILFPNNRGLNVPEEVFTRINFLRLYLQLMLTVAKSDKKLLILECLQHINQEEFKLLSLNQPTEYKGIQILQRNILELVASQEKEAIVEYIKLAKETIHAEDQQNCFVCNAKVDVYYIRLLLPNTSKRIVSICPNCGIIEDKDEFSESIRLKILDKRLYLEGNDLLKLNWDAQILYNYKLNSLCYTALWPKDSDDKLLPNILLKDSLSPGPVYITIFFMQELKFSMIRMPYRIV